LEGGTRACATAMRGDRVCARVNVCVDASDRASDRSFVRWMNTATVTRTNS
jgi:hypothetical protein